MTPYDTYQHVLEAVSVAALVAFLAALVTVKMWPYITAAWDKLGKERARKAFVFLATMATLTGGAKFISGKVTFPRTDPEMWYILDNGSYVTNDCVQLKFTRNLVVPASARFWLYALDRSYTNEADWAEHSFAVYSNQFANISATAAADFSVQYPNATNFNWIGFTDWTPGPVVHTNGVALVNWRSIHDTTNAVAPYRTPIYFNWRRAAPSPAITNGPPTTATRATTTEETP